MPVLHPVVVTRARSRLLRLLAGPGALVLLAGLAACGGEAETGSSAAPSDDQSRAGGSATLTSPLTGEQVDGELPEYPVLAVKVDNSSSADPQLGLEQADVVTEELVEGGSTRLAAFFWSELPDVVGPVRSMRASDIGIVKPADAVLVASGGAGPTKARMDGAGIQTALDGAPGYERAGDRPTPYNLMMQLPELAETLEGTGPPAPYLLFGDAPSGGKPASAFDVKFSGGHTTSWSYEKGTGYQRTNAPVEQGDDFLPRSVLVLEVEVGDAGYLDPAGNPVPETVYEGNGKAMLFADGQVVSGTWSKAELRSPLALKSASGDPLEVPTGSTFIELVPKGEGTVDVGG